MIKILEKDENNQIESSLIFQFNRDNLNDADEWNRRCNYIEQDE